MTLLGAVVGLALAVPPDGVLVDRVIAVVDKEVITHSELVREARIALVRREGERAATSELDAELLAAFLDEILINEVLIAGQARRLGGVDVPEEAIDAAVERFAQRFRTRAAYSAFLRRYDISEAALRNVLRRDLRNARYIEDRMRAWRGRDEGVGEDERYREALRKWLKELRAGVELRTLSPDGVLELQDSGSHR